MRIEQVPRGLVVVAPHLDDAVLSLGATVAYAARVGVRVTVLTVFAGDPASDAPAGVWDRLCGFATAGEAARARREEDRSACDLLGAQAIWLPFADGDYPGARKEDEVWAAIEPHLAHAALALVPGYPLVHADHAWLTRLIASRASDGFALGLYVEQPYANLAVIGRGHLSPPVLARAAAIALRAEHGRLLQRPAIPNELEKLFAAPIGWCASHVGRRDHSAKLEAIERYRSQTSFLGRRLTVRIRLYERGWGGEGIGLPTVASHRPRRRAPLPWDARDLLGEDGAVRRRLIGRPGGDSTPGGTIRTLAHGSPSQEEDVP